MNTIKVAVSSKNLASYVLVNDKAPKFRKDKEIGLLVAEVECEGDTADIKLEPFHHLLAPGWWIMNLFLFIVTVFGIFQSRSYFKKFVPQYHSIVHLGHGENLVKISEEDENEEKVIRIDKESEMKVDELINYKDYDKRIKKRRGLMVLTDILFSVFALSIFILIIFLD